MSCQNIWITLVYMTILNKTMLISQAAHCRLYHSASALALLAEVKESKLKTLLSRHAKFQTVNVDGSRYVLMPKGLHHAETA